MNQKELSIAVAQQTGIKIPLKERISEVTDLGLIEKISRQAGVFKLSALFHLDSTEVLNSNLHHMFRNQMGTASLITVEIHS